MPVILNPWDKVLVRDTETQAWHIELYSHYNSEYGYPFVCLRTSYKYCIPYEGNEELLETTNPVVEHDEPKQEKEIDKIKQDKENEFAYGDKVEGRETGREWVKGIYLGVEAHKETKKYIIVIPEAKTNSFSILGMRCDEIRPCNWNGDELLNSMKNPEEFKFGEYVEVSNDKVNVAWRHAVYLGMNQEHPFPYNVITKDNHTPTRYRFCRKSKWRP